MYEDHHRRPLAIRSRRPIDVQAAISTALRPGYGQHEWLKVRQEGHCAMLADPEQAHARQVIAIHPTMSQALRTLPDNR